jgi:hypothetical protein
MLGVMVSKAYPVFQGVCGHSLGSVFVVYISLTVWGGLGRGILSYDVTGVLFCGGVGLGCH